MAAYGNKLDTSRLGKNKMAAYGKELNAPKPGKNKMTAYGNELDAPKPGKNKMAAYGNELDAPKPGKKERNLLSEVIPYKAKMKAINKLKNGLNPNRLGGPFPPAPFPGGKKKRTRRLKNWMKPK